MYDVTQHPNPKPHTQFEKLSHFIAMIISTNDADGEKIRGHVLGKCAKIPPRHKRAYMVRHGMTGGAIEPTKGQFGERGSLSGRATILAISCRLRDALVQGDDPGDDRL